MIAVVSTVVKRCQCNMQHIIFRRYQHRLACCRVPAMQATASSPPSPSPNLCHLLLQNFLLLHAARPSHILTSLPSHFPTPPSPPPPTALLLALILPASNSFCIPALHNIHTFSNSSTIFATTTFSTSSSFL